MASSLKSSGGGGVDRGDSVKNAGGARWKGVGVRWASEDSESPSGKSIRSDVGTLTCPGGRTVFCKEGTRLSSSSVSRWMKDDCPCRVSNSQSRSSSAALYLREVYIRNFQCRARAYLDSLSQSNGSIKLALGAACFILPMSSWSVSLGLLFLIHFVFSNSSADMRC